MGGGGAPVCTNLREVAPDGDVPMVGRALSTVAELVGWFLGVGWASFQIAYQIRVNAKLLRPRIQIMTKKALAKLDGKHSTGPD